MKKYHIGPNGPAVCNAVKGNCPFGDLSNHYNSKHEAEIAFEDQMLGQYGMFSTIESNPTIYNEEPSAPQFSPTKSLESLNSVYYLSKENKYRLSQKSYTAILEMSQDLSSLLRTEAKDPSRSPDFEYELEMISNEFLPNVVEGYLKVPQSLIHQMQPNGRTPEKEFNEQLKLLKKQTEFLYSSRHQDNISKVTTTGNFLRERFSHLTNSLEP